MRLSDILTSDRILVDPSGGVVHDKKEALRLLASMMAPAVGTGDAEVERLLSERERLQSTGIGDGVAIPHTSIEGAPQQAAALLLCRQGVEFDAIDGHLVHIIFGVVGPKKATGEHLKVLARISRLLRDETTRSRLATSEDVTSALELIRSQDAALG